MRNPVDVGGGPSFCSATLRPRGAAAGADGSAAGVAAGSGRSAPRALHGMARVTLSVAGGVARTALLVALPLAGAALASPGATLAQQPDSTPRAPSTRPLALSADGHLPVIGLALSGGSAKGFAHVGVMRELERAGIRVEVVAGTSMGSVIGGLYAIDLPLDSIEAIISSVDWPSVLGDAATRDRRFLDQRRFDERAVATLPLQGGIVSLPSGAAAGSNIVRLAEQSTWRAATIRSFDLLPRPFAAVATDIETGEAVTLRSGVLSEALRASTGIPGAFEPFELDGRLLVDGALSRNLPSSDARSLGADYVICSDVSDPLVSAEQLGSIVDVLDQVMTLTMRQAMVEARAECDLLIRTDVEGLPGFGFDRYEEWFERGRAAAEPFADTLRALAARQRPASPLPPRSPFLPDSVRVASVAIRGASGPERERFVLGELRVLPGTYVTPERLADRLSDIDATGLFGLVRYRLDTAQDGVALAVEVREQPRDRVGVGLRYDDERRAALLFTGTLHNLVGYGSVTRLDLRVGEETRATASVRRRHGVTGRFEGGGSVGWSQAELPIPGFVDATTQYEITNLGAFIGLVAGRTTFVGVEADAEWAVVDFDAIGSSLLVSASLVLEHESLDRVDFPRAGTDGSVRWETGATDVEEGQGFSVLTGSGRFYLPLSDRVTLEVGGFVGVASGLDLPIHRTFFIGGRHPSSVFGAWQPVFLGLGRGALQGTHTSVGRGALRVEVRDGLFVRLAGDVGAATNDWEFPVRDPVVGIGASISLRTLIGPVTLEWSRADRGDGSRLSVGVGRTF